MSPRSVSESERTSSSSQFPGLPGWPGALRSRSGIPLRDKDQAVGWLGFPVWRAMLAGGPGGLAAGEREADASENESEAEELAEGRPLMAGEVDVDVAGHGLNVDQQSGGGGRQPGGGGVPQPGPAPGDSDAEQGNASEEHCCVAAAGGWPARVAQEGDRQERGEGDD